MKSTRPQFEFNIVEVTLESEGAVPDEVRGTLQLAGADGWGMVSVLALPLADGRTKVVYHFQRELSKKARKAMAKRSKDGKPAS